MDKRRLPQTLEQRQRTSLVLKGHQQSSEHIAARVAGRKAKGSWFKIPDIGDRIGAGKRSAFAALPEAEQEIVRAHARSLGLAKRNPDRFCERCGVLIAGSNARQPQRRFCSRACRNKVIKPYQGHVPLGEDRTCPACDKTFFVKRAYLRPVNYCSRACAAKARTGEKNANWRNGATSEQVKFRSSDEYHAWRLAVFTRDGFRCIRCGHDKLLHAHHIKPAAQFPALRLDVSNGETLCLTCHEVHHGSAIHDNRLGPEERRSRRMFRKVERECPVCQKQFYLATSAVRTVNYCSRSCLAKAQSQPRIESVCPTCGISFSRKASEIRTLVNYCSHRCTALAINRNNKGFSNVLDRDNTLLSRHSP